MENMKKIGLIVIVAALGVVGSILVSKHYKMSDSEDVTIQYSVKNFTQDANKGLKKADTTCGPNKKCNSGQHCIDGTCRTGYAGSTCHKDSDCDDDYYCTGSAPGCQKRSGNEGDSCCKSACKSGLTCKYTNCHDAGDAGTQCDSCICEKN